MTVNSYLTTLASQAIIRDSEKDGIRRSLATLQARLNAYFGTTLTRHFVFGSYSRGTILPRRMDARSDIDYMVVFSGGHLQPQTYLDQLRRFVITRYSRSEIAQSHPTIVLSLNHIRFELVPALDGLFWGLQIPAKASDTNQWVTTDPTGFNSDLRQANQSNGNLIKPLVRLVKYWNACNGYPFESYDLEQKVIKHPYWHLALLGRNQQNYFFSFMQGLDAGWGAAQYKRDAIQRAQRIIGSIKAYEAAGNSTAAEREIQRLLPCPSLPSQRAGFGNSLLGIQG